MLLKERSSGMYRVSAFYASTVAADLPMDTVLPVGVGGWGGTRGGAAVAFGAAPCGLAVPRQLALFSPLRHPPPRQALFCVTIYFMGGLRLTAAAFFANVAVMALITLTAQVGAAQDGRGRPA